jgi:hypothetical protein
MLIFVKKKSASHMLGILAEGCFLYLPLVLLISQLCIAVVLRRIAFGLEKHY